MKADVCGPDDIKPNLTLFYQSVSPWYVINMGHICVTVSNRSSRCMNRAHRLVVNSQSECMWSGRMAACFTALIKPRR